MVVGISSNLEINFRRMSIFTILNIYPPLQEQGCLSVCLPSQYPSESYFKFSPRRSFNFLFNLLLCALSFSCSFYNGTLLYYAF